MKPKITDLAKAIRPVPAAETKPPKVNSEKVKQAIASRLIANEYLRNGLNIKQAYEAITKRKYSPVKFSAIVADNDSAFLNEIDTALKSSDVEKSRVLALLWAMATTSPLDYMDDDGVPLSVADLKKLPRELQAIIEEIFVETTYERAMGDDGPVKGENGELLMVPRQRVRIKVSGKQAALNTVAQIGKLIGPAVLQNNYITNIGQIMIDADSRRDSLLIERATRPKVKFIEHDSGDK